MTPHTANGQDGDNYQIPDADHRDNISLSPIYHVGDLGEEREKPHTSYEGRGVSVSVHPKTWERILRGDGTSTHEVLKTYQLSNPSAEFYYIDPAEPLSVERDWCIENEYVDVEAGFKVTYKDEVNDSAYMKFNSRETAELEAKALGGHIKDTEILTLDTNGAEYWTEAFQQAPNEADPILIAGLTPVWYAEHHGFDGVWWDEKFDPENYSAPRGVIFQSRLKEWGRTIKSRSRPGKPVNK